MNQFTIEELMAMDEPTRQWALENGLVEGGTPRVGFGPMVDQSQLGLGTQPGYHPDLGGYGGGNVGSSAPVYGTNYSPQASYSSAPPTYAMNNPNPTYSGDPGDSMRNPNYDVTGQEGLLDGADEAGAGDSNALGYAMLGNSAGNMINSHDKELVDTPMGNQGSVSGMMKGTVKGASTGGTAGFMIGGPKGAGVGAVVGGTLGLLGGAQGYFDSRTPPQTRTQTVTPMRGAGFSGQATSLFG